MARGKRKRKGFNAVVMPEEFGSERSFRAQQMSPSLSVGLAALRSEGFLLELPDGTLMPTANYPLAYGLTQIDLLQPQPDGSYLVRFQDGSQGLLAHGEDGWRASFSDGAAENDWRVLAALAAIAADRRDDSGDNLWQRFQANPGDPEVVQEIVQASHQRLLESTSWVSLNDPQLRERLEDSHAAPAAVVPASYRRGVAASLAGAQVGLAVGRRTETSDGENLRQLKGMIFGADESGEPLDLNPVLFELGQQAAEALDRPVVERDFIEELYLNDTMNQALGTIFERYTRNKRTFGLMGAPGTGKDTTVKVVAALLGRPLVTLQGGKGVNVQGWMGDTALRPHEVYRNCGTCAACKAGKGGECSDRQLVASFNISDVQYGMLAKALQQPAVVHISEVKGMEDQLTALHDIMDADAVNPAENRFFTINSAEGDETIKVNPHCMLFLSWNPGVDDWRPHPATLSRMGVFSFDPLDEAQEGRRLAAMVNAMMDNLAGYPEFQDPRNKFTGADLIPVARFAKRFNNAVEAEADEMSTEGSPRLFSEFVCDLIVKSAGHIDNYDDAEAPDRIIQWALHAMEGYLNQNLPSKERRKKLTKLLGDAQGPLADLILNVRRLVRGEIEALPHVPDEAPTAA